MADGSASGPVGGADAWMLPGIADAPEGGDAGNGVAAAGAGESDGIATDAMLDAIAVLRVVAAGSGAAGAFAIAPKLNDPAGQAHWQLHASGPV